MDAQLTVRPNGAELTCETTGQGQLFDPDDIVGDFALAMSLLAKQQAPAHAVWSDSKCMRVQRNLSVALGANLKYLY